MVKLSDRLRRMAECVEPGETVADIGTDHGLLPIFLYETKRSSRLILCDVNAGPLKRAEENVIRYSGREALEQNRRRCNPSDIACLERSVLESACLNRSAATAADLKGSASATVKLGENPAFCLRQGDGLAPLEAGEAQAVILAGMGGILISDILQAALEKARSVSRLVLQPRNHCPELRKWLLDNKFQIYHEFLVREGIYICQVICARPQVNLPPPEPFQIAPELEFEISPIWIRQNDPLLEEFLSRKIAVERKITEKIRTGASDRSAGSRKRLVVSEQEDAQNRKNSSNQSGRRNSVNVSEQAAVQNQGDFPGRPCPKDSSDASEQAVEQICSDLQKQADLQAFHMREEKLQTAQRRLEMFEELYHRLFGEDSQPAKRSGD